MFSDSTFLMPNQSSPERRLLAAILQRAVFDYIGAVPEERQEAAKWFFSDPVNEGQFSFNWVCSQLDIAPDTLRRQIRELPRLEKKATPQQWLAQREAA